MSRLVRTAENTKIILTGIPYRVGVLGGTGNLGSAVVKRLTKAREEGHIQGEILFSSTGRDPAKSKILKRLGAREASNQEVMEESDVTFGCVKPAIAPTILSEALRWHRSAGSVFIPFFAATTPSDTARHIGSGKGLVNGMTGLGTEIGAGVTFLCAHPETNKQERLLAEYAAGLLGEVHWFKDEESHLLHLATSIVGCLPAYFAYAVDAVQTKAQALGIKDPSLAEKVVRSTMLATGRLMAEKNISAADLMKQVATKGGVTRGGLDIFDAKNTGKLFGEVIEANVERCKTIAATLNTPATAAKPSAAAPAEVKTPSAGGGASPTGFWSSERAPAATQKGRSALKPSAELDPVAKCCR